MFFLPRNLSFCPLLWSPARQSLAHSLITTSTVPASQKLWAAEQWPDPCTAPDLCLLLSLPPGVSSLPFTGCDRSQELDCPGQPAFDPRVSPPSRVGIPRLTSSWLHEFTLELRKQASLKFQGNALVRMAGFS